MTKDLIRYDLLVQDALKGVVRKVLGDAAKHGLSGDHHFYVSFRTDFPGVRISNRLREKYPQEMTIVLQHQFWDLAVTEHAFEVGLSFSGVPERLLVPFDAVIGFFDPVGAVRPEVRAQRRRRDGAGAGAGAGPGARRRPARRSLGTGGDAATEARRAGHGQERRPEARGEARRPPTSRQRRRRPRSPKPKSRRTPLPAPRSSASTRSARRAELGRCRPRVGARVAQPQRHRQPAAGAQRHPVHAA